ncbi:cytosolic purine 5-nucleotidase [Biomphalaria pfeifferi]|uniref:Cytosolic purine 5-nucleotidase n=1 Tax=Biomphalaria pfeifferi TaxID=112525 RepID=A0AAD8BG50_BIOPF|nr:cytosolic purine 5-nucleotidase [Biomphalaria pfeifferi]
MAESPTTPEVRQGLERKYSMSSHMYKREPSKRVFVNRSLMLEKVRFFGFDMDYTLAMYKSPEYETLGFNHLKQRLVNMGYPEAIIDFEYDPSFPIRGLWFDTYCGTLLKVDGFGNILVCLKGFQFLRSADIRVLYPTMFVQMDETRFRIFNTLYELPLIYILACLIDYFNNNTEYNQTRLGVRAGDVTMTYESIYNDVNAAMEYVHAGDGPLKADTVKNVNKYIVQDERLPVLLSRLRENGKKVFLATNSDYKYTNKVMNYLFDTGSNPDKKCWTSFFDFIVVDAKKPLFFLQGTLLREVNKTTGGLHLGTFTGKIKQNAIYSGGSVEVFNELMGANESLSEVLYVGDHIFGDILKSKKALGWRTFLVVPEMVQELGVWTEKSYLFSKLSEYDYEIAEVYRNLDSSHTGKPDISQIQADIRAVTHEMDQAYGTLGSVFRSGSRQTFFATQVMRYADLYAASFMNMLYYPFTYCFRAPPMHMPHESTVDHEARLSEEQFRKISLAWRARASIPLTPKDASVKPPIVRADSTVPRLYCETPDQLTEVGDEFLAEHSSVSDFDQ